MANYIELATGRYPVSQSQIKAENPNTSYPANFPVPTGFALVFPAPAPVPANPVLQMVREIAPVLTQLGTYQQAYEVVDKFSAYIDDQDVPHTKAAQEAEAIAADQAVKLSNLIVSVTTATQQRLDAFAKTRNYDGIHTAATYGLSKKLKFKNEGQRAVDAMTDTWDALYTIMAEVEAGTRPLPTSFADIEPDLPVLSWPT